MSRRFPPSRWVLPEVVDPLTTVCFQVPVPNDIHHIAAFKGAIFELAKAYSWQNDDAHTAKDVAAVWLNIFNNLEECTMQVQFRQIEDCFLQASFDGGDTWANIFDASACVTQGILDGVASGTISAGGQQPAEGDGVPGQCYTYHVKLDGNGRWISPVKVEENDIVTVTNAQGAWYDGAIFSTWYCGDGNQFTLGACIGITVTDPGDPDPSINHMRLIGSIPTQTPPYFDMWNTAHTITALSAAADLTLQANDSVLDDNQGSITFDVEICKNGGIYKALNGNGNAADITIVPGYGVLDGSGEAINGSQTFSGTPASDVELQTVLTFSHTLNIRRIKVTFIHDARRNIPGGSSPDECGVYDAANFGSPLYTYNFSPTAPDFIEHTVDSGPININKSVLYVAGYARNNTTGDGAKIQLKYLEITYTGAPPF